MEQYTLNDLERLTGIKADTIRMWEQRFRITFPQRTSTNRKYYKAEDLRKLINIAVLKSSGIKISDIAAMPLRELENRSEELSKDNYSTDILTGSLIIAMTKFDEAAVNQILLRSVIRNGFERTFSSVVFPFLQKVGVMWHTGSASVSAEHFVSNIFRQRLIVALDNQSQIATPGSRRILMFLPEGEFHELGLLYYAYILRSLGHMVLYLGQSTPLSALTGASEKWNPEILITGAKSALPFKDADKFIGDLIGLFPGKCIILNGFLADIAEKRGLKGVLSCRSEKDLKSIVKSFR